MPDKMLVLQGALYVIVGMLTPVLVMLSAELPITGRTLAAAIIGGIIGGAGALKAFLSETYSRSYYTLTEKPKPF